MSQNKSIHQFNQGDTFHDRYTLLNIIGVGGFADVWKATDNITGTTIALKIYTNLDDDGIKDLATEYTQMARLSHTNILKADHFDRWGNIPYLTMKLCEGGSLEKRIGKMSVDEVKKMIKDVSAGLAYLHESGIVHQDIKPHNILVSEYNGKITYVLSDFGISTKTKTRLSKSVAAATAGLSMTEAYAPPEKFSPKREERRPNRLGDIFSLGITIYEIVSGNLPFDELSTGRQLQYENVEVDFSEIDDPDIRRMVTACMRRVRDERPTADQLPGILAGTVTQHGGSDGPVPPPPVPGGGSGGGGDIKVTTKVGEFPGGPVTPVEPRKKSLLKPILIGVGVIAVLAIVGLVISNLTSSDHDDEPYITEVDTFDINGEVTIEMVKIPGGEFTLGAVDDAEADSIEMPAKTRYMDSFYMSRYEVTQKLWETVMGSNPSTVKGDSLPVNNVSYQDCVAFIKKLNSKLGMEFAMPTEAQWEYAAKGSVDKNGTFEDTNFLYAGTDKNVDAYAWYAANSGSTIHPVGMKKPNRFGLYDMSGNVIEWCTDVYLSYDDNSPLLGDKERVLRGGWYDASVDQLRSTNRGSCDLGQAEPAFGLRLVLNK